MLDISIESDLDLHLAVIASRILDSLSDRDRIPFEISMSNFLKSNSQYTPTHYADGLTFLFALGCIQMNHMKIEVTHV